MSKLFDLGATDPRSILPLQIALRRGKAGMKRHLLKARRFGHFTMRGFIYAQSLDARDELAVALKHLKRDARQAARAAMDYLKSGGRIDEWLSLNERKRLLELIRAQVELDVRKMKQWQKARSGWGEVQEAVGSATGRPLFLPLPSPERTPTPATHPSASTEQPFPPAARSISSRKRFRSPTARLDPAARANAPAPSPAVSLPPWFGLCPQRSEFSRKLLDNRHFSFLHQAGVAACNSTDKP